jgi:ankyrin repeat protein
MLTNARAPLSALVSACRGGDLEAVRASLAREPALAQAPEVLVAAAREGRAAVVALLLEAGAPVDPVDPAWWPRRALLQCLSPSVEKHAGHVEVARRLLAAGADLVAGGQFQELPPLQVAAAAGDGALVEVLRAAGAPVDLHGAAAIYDMEALARQLGESPSQVHALDARGRTPLHALAASRLWRAGAREEGRALGAARLLLAAGADLDAPQRLEGKYQGSPLWWAVSAGRCEALIGLLLEAGAGIEGCLLAAAWQGAEGVIRRLVSVGADIDERDVRGHTALQHVLLFKRPEAVGCLLALGADPAAVTEQGHTALHLAALSGHGEEVLSALLAAGAPLEARDHEGRDAAALAASRGHEAAARYLTGAARRA